LNALLQLFLHNLAPILLIVALGSLLQRKLQVDPAPLSRTVFYLFTPALVFDLLVHTDIPVEALFRMGSFALAATLIMLAIAFVVGKGLRLSQGTLAAFLLVVIFSNNGNFGLSLNRFAFGRQALAHASIYYVTSAMLMHSLGVYIAGSGRSSPAHALRGLLRVPAVFAIPLAILLRSTGWHLPQPLWRPIELLSDATIPAMLVVLGLQISNSGKLTRPRLLLIASALRMVLSPALGFAMGRTFGLQGPALQAGISEAAMPAAVTTSILALEFDIDPDFVSGAILLTTVLSPLTLTPLVALLGP
jgi:predicted permease